MADEKKDSKNTLASFSQARDKKKKKESKKETPAHFVLRGEDLERFREIEELFECTSDPNIVFRKSLEIAHSIMSKMKGKTPRVDSILYRSPKGEDYVLYFSGHPYKKK